MKKVSHKYKSNFEHLKLFGSISTFEVMTLIRHKLKNYTVSVNLSSDIE